MQNHSSVSLETEQSLSASWQRLKDTGAYLRRAGPLSHITGNETKSRLASVSTRTKLITLTVSDVRARAKSPWPGLAWPGPLEGLQGPRARAMISVGPWPWAAARAGKTKFYLSKVCIFFTFGSFERHIASQMSSRDNYVVQQCNMVNTICCSVVKLRIYTEVTL